MRWPRIWTRRTERPERMPYGVKGIISMPIVPAEPIDIAAMAPQGLPAAIVEVPDTVTRAEFDDLRERFMPGAFDGLEGKEVPVTCAGRPIGVAKLHVDDTGLHAEIVRK